ncbi:MAG TPA: IniB N-terminal domain-containing protein, partial [Micromonospora sp.]
MHSMDSHQTLHDFVLDLLTNPDARSAFDLDPEGALQAAGLTDVTAADVQEVVPLVMDYAPVHGLGALPPVGDVTGAGTTGVIGDPNDAIHQLQTIAQQVTTNPVVSTTDVNAWAAGAMTVDPLGSGQPLVGNGSFGLEFGGPGAGLSVGG